MQFLTFRNCQNLVEKKPSNTKPSIAVVYLVWFCHWRRFHYTVFFHRIFRAFSFELVNSEAK